MKVLILCGGLGTRLAEETALKQKLKELDLPNGSVIRVTVNFSQ